MAGTLSSPNPNDYKCPICLDLLYDPVTLPCSHAMCYSCFHTNRDESNLHCPLCRTRYSVWARRLAKKGPRAFVDECRARKIKDLFPDLYERRLKGGEEPVISDDPQQTILSSSGAIREEYEQLLKEVRAEREKEDEASQPVLAQLRAEAEAEHQRLAEIERQSAEDEFLARKFAEQEEYGRQPVASLSEIGSAAHQNDSQKGRSHQAACSSSCSCGSTRTLFPVPPTKRRRSSTSTPDSSAVALCRQGLTSWLHREVPTTPLPENNKPDASAGLLLSGGGKRKAETPGECLREFDSCPRPPDSPEPVEYQHWIVDMERTDHELEDQQIEADHQLALRIQQQFDAGQAESSAPLPELKHNVESPPRASSKTSQRVGKASVRHAKTPPSSVTKNTAAESQSLLSRWLEPLIPKRLKV